MIKHHLTRSCPLATFASILAVPGVSFYNLQLGDSAADLADLLERYPIEDLSPYINDFADTAALVRQMDLVISVDTAIVHLAGALGTPVWVLLSRPHDWRWLLSRTDSPWYPSARLFRQTTPGKWDAVIQQVADALRQQVVRGAIAPAYTALGHKL